MNALLNATVKLYLDAATSTSKAIFRHPFKPLLGFLFIFVTVLVENCTGLFPGFVGGLILGIALTFILAGFLAVINLIFDSKKFNLQEAVNLTVGIFSPLLNSLFILYIAKFLLQPLLMNGDGQLWIRIIFVILFVLFNVLPEEVSRRGIGGLDSFKESLEFMKENGPEWIAALFLIFLPLIIIAGPELVMNLISSDDPLGILFKLIRYSVLAFGLILEGQSFPGIAFVQIFLMIVGVYYVFFIFLFRTALFESLNNSTRRKRIYTASLK